MTVFEVLSFHKGLLRQLDDAGIKTEDFRFVDLFEDYKKMKQEGYKKTYIVAVLAERYTVSERTVYGVLRRLSANLRGG